MNTKERKNKTQTNKNLLFWRNKNMKTAKALLALTLTIFLAFGSIIPVFAVSPVLDNDGKPTGAYKADSETEVLSAVVAKRLKTGIATETPAETFRFIATPLSFDSVTADANKLPQLGPNKDNIIPIAYTKGNHPGEVETDINGNTVKYVYRESANIFAGVTFTQSGDYTWTIMEQTGTFANTATEEMIYNTTTKYEITAYVQQKSDGSGYYIWAIGTKIVVVDEGNKDGAKQGDKVDPAPGGPNEGNNWKHSGMVFTNKYIKKGGTPTNPETDANSLSVLKRVAGTYKDENAYFNYAMTFKKNTVSSAETTPKTTFIAYILNTNATGTNTSVVTGTDLTKNKILGTGVNVNATTGAITIPYGVADFTFSLKANQTIAFFEIYVGTTYTITELAPTNYIPAVEVKYYDKKSAYKTFNDTASISANLAVVNDKDTTDPSLLFIGEPNANTVKFTNTRELVTPTGLNLNDLPFIGMIIIAVIGVAGYVVFKFRKNGKAKNLNLN